MKCFTRLYSATSHIEDNMVTTKQIVDEIYLRAEDVLEEFRGGKDYFLLFDEWEEDEIEVTVGVTQYKHKTCHEDCTDMLHCMDEFLPIVKSIKGLKKPVNPELINEVNAALQDSGKIEIDYYE